MLAKRKRDHVPGTSPQAPFTDAAMKRGHRPDAPGGWKLVHEVPWSRWVPGALYAEVVELFMALLGFGALAWGGCRANTSRSSRIGRRSEHGLCLVLSCCSPPPSRGGATTVLGHNCSTWSAAPSPTRASYSTSPSRCARPSESATGSGRSRPTAEPGTFPTGPSPTLSVSRETSRPGGTSGSGTRAERRSSLGFGSTSADRRALHRSLGGR